MVKVKPFCSIDSMWQKVLRDSRRTVGKNELTSVPSDRFKTSILRSKHSPIRKLKFEIFISEIPVFVVQQFSRHHIALESDPTVMWCEDIKPTDIEHFVQTSRSDRTNVDRSTRKQTDLVSYNFEANAQGLLDASKKRLCHAADSEAVKYWTKIKLQISEICPELAERMQPECVCSGFCPEDPALVPCRFSKTVKFKQLREKYKQ